MQPQRSNADLPLNVTDVFQALVAVVVAAGGVIMIVELVRSLRRPVKNTFSPWTLLFGSLGSALPVALGWWVISLGLAAPTSIIGRKSPSHGWSIAMVGASLVTVAFAFMISPIFHVIAKRRHGEDQGRSRKRAKRKPKGAGKSGEKAAPPEVVGADRSEGVDN